MLISGTTELAAVQPVLKFMRGVLVRTNIMSFATSSLFFWLLFYCNVKCEPGLKSSFTERGLRQTLRKVPQNSCCGAPFGSFANNGCFILKNLWIASDLIKISEKMGTRSDCFSFTSPNIQPCMLTEVGENEWKQSTKREHSWCGYDCCITHQESVRDFPETKSRV